MPRRPEFLLLALDLGSSSTRAGLFDDRGRGIASTGARQEYAIDYAADGRAELAPQTLKRAVEHCYKAILRQRQNSAALRKVPVIAISASSFWHGLLGLDRTGQPTTPIYTWADSRSEIDAVTLRGECNEPELLQRTGCMLRAPYWPAKLRWLQRTDRALYKRTARWVSPASWIFGRVFGYDFTSRSLCSGTGLYNLGKRTWDAEMCDLCDVDPAQLGALEKRGSGEFDTAEGPPIIFAAIGDGAASNLGSGADSSRQIAVNVGTSAAVRTAELLRAGKSARIPDGLFRHVIDANRTLLGGAISNAGNLRHWCLRELQLDANVEKALARTSAADDRLTVLPFLVGERAPTWPGAQGGTVAGLTQATTAAEIFRAATTASYYRLAAILERIETVTASAERIIVSGGLLKSPASLALLADCLGRDLEVCREAESSLRGAAVYALEQLGRQAAPLRPGRTIRRRPELAEKHRVRRSDQAALEAAQG